MENADPYTVPTKVGFEPPQSRLEKRRRTSATDEKLERKYPRMESDEGNQDKIRGRDIEEGKDQAEPYVDNTDTDEIDIMTILAHFKELKIKRSGTEKSYVNHDIRKRKQAQVEPDFVRLSFKENIQ